jgi:hypothetical protein
VLTCAREADRTTAEKFEFAYLIALRVQLGDETNGVLIPFVMPYDVYVLHDV